MMKRDPHKMSDALFTMQIELIRYEKDGVFWSAQEVRDLNDHLRILAAYSRDLENEVLRLRKMTPDQQQETGRLTPPVCNHENVVLFPQSTQPPRGGAA